jgi:hypothetical protein
MITKSSCLALTISDTEWDIGGVLIDNDITPIMRGAHNVIINRAMRVYLEYGFSCFGQNRNLIVLYVQYAYQRID